MRVLPADAEVTGAEPYDDVIAALLAPRPYCGCFARPLRFRCGKPPLAPVSLLLTNRAWLGAAPGAGDDCAQGFVNCGELEYGAMWSKFICPNRCWLASIVIVMLLLYPTRRGVRLFLLVVGDNVLIKCEIPKR